MIKVNYLVEMTINCCSHTMNYDCVEISFFINKQMNLTMNINIEIMGIQQIQAEMINPKINLLSKNKIQQIICCLSEQMNCILKLLFIFYKLFNAAS